MTEQANGLSPLTDVDTVRGGDLPEVANDVPHIRIWWDATATKTTAADVVRALRDREPSIGTRSEGETDVVVVWMMRPGEEKIVVRRLRRVLSGASGQRVKA